MSTSQTIAPYLPFLRRYARALTGNQTSGDAYVAAALEALIEDPSVLEGPASPRVALYRLFTKIWNSVVVNGVRRRRRQEPAGRAAPEQSDPQAAPGVPAGRA